MTAPSGPSRQPLDTAADAAPAAPVAVAEPRQRWRLTFARELPPEHEVPTGREYVGRWEETLLAAGLPVLVLATGRPRVALGAPLPSNCSAEGELLEFWLTAVRPAWQVREGLARALLTGHRIVDLESVWVGAPALSGQVAAADYEVAARIDEGRGADVAAAVERILGRPRVPWERRKGGETRTVDLRPLIVALEVDDRGAAGFQLRMRTRIHPELGTGRPDEVVGALAAESGVPIAIERIVRRRLLLADDLGR
ncbi:MAG TPA: TIGR03936 family radical SAM-associated protein [Candidatus Limnocylindrales bacterium]|nr:TIGR03936 family radical SAM-associated protein [Candidatus Limnocylindrales bacterium]